jgi:hypothetical protein
LRAREQPKNAPSTPGAGVMSDRRATTGRARGCPAGARPPASARRCFCSSIVVLCCREGPVVCLLMLFVCFVGVAQRARAVVCVTKWFGRESRVCVFVCFKLAAAAATSKGRSRRRALASSPRPCSPPKVWDPNHNHSTQQNTKHGIANTSTRYVVAPSLLTAACAEQHTPKRAVAPPSLKRTQPRFSLRRAAAPPCSASSRRSRRRSSSWARS